MDDDPPSIPSSIPIVSHDIPIRNSMIITNPYVCWLYPGYIPINYITLIST